MWVVVGVGCCCIVVLYWWVGVYEQGQWVYDQDVDQVQIVIGFLLVVVVDEMLDDGWLDCVVQVVVVGVDCYGDVVLFVELQ